MRNSAGGDGLFRLLIFLFIIPFLFSGCYYFTARNEMRNAEKQLTYLKWDDGPILVPYEYTSAETFLEISRKEFDQADYRAAKDFAVRSQSAAQAGLTEVKKKK